MLKSSLAAICTSFLDDTSGGRIVILGLNVMSAEQADQKNQQSKHRFASFCHPPRSDRGGDAERAQTADEYAQLCFGVL
jgi:hypothetical protein